MKKFLNKKCSDLTVGETFKFTIIYSAIFYAVIIVFFKIDDILDSIGELKDKIFNWFTSYKRRKDVNEEEPY